MNDNYHNDAHQQRISVLRELEREPAIEAWTKLKIGLNEESGAEELGLHLEYFRKLIADEFVNQLNDGVSLIEFPELTISLEDHCWKAICEKIGSKLANEIQTPICKQLRTKLLKLYKDGLSLYEISDRLKLVEKSVKALIMIALVESGLTLDKTGAKFKITRERTRQIIETVGFSITSINKE